MSTQVEAGGLPAVPPTTEDDASVLEIAKEILINAPKQSRIRTSIGEALYILGGATKGFSIYFVPVYAMQRRIDAKTVRRALAIGIFTALFRSLDRLIRHLHQKEVLREKSTLVGKISRIFIKYRRSVASAVAMLSIFAVDPNIDSSVFVLWMFVRAVRCAVQWKTILPEWMPIALMSLSSAQVLSSWVMAPDELDPMYLKFLDIHGGHPRHLLAYLGGPVRPHHHCRVIHPYETCTQFVIRFGLSSFRRSARLYLPLSLLMLVISRNHSIKEFFLNWSRSTLFLTFYCSMALGIGCFVYNNLTVGWNRWKLFAHTWTSGLALLFEKPARRVELAAYVSTYALDSVYRGFVKRKYIPEGGYPVIGRLILILSAAVMLHRWKQQPRFVTCWLLGVEEDKIAPPSPPVVSASPSRP